MTAAADAIMGVFGFKRVKEATFRLPYPPSANRYWRIAGNRLYASQEAKAFKLIAGMTAKRAGVRVADGPMAVAVTLHPKLTKKGADSKMRIDLDNALKVTLDALNGVAWEDDSQVVVIRAAIGSGIDGGGLTINLGPAE